MKRAARRSETPGFRPTHARSFALGHDDWRTLSEGWLQRSLEHRTGASDRRTTERPTIVYSWVPSSDRFDMVLTNPPFGRKSSVQIVNAEGRAERQNLTVLRDDFWASTSNKQLNFVQHVKTLLDVGGTAAVVVPDNVLFEGGAGETIRRRLLRECDVHTLLRLPTGIFYAQGVKANVLFFDRKPGSDTPWTRNLWIYDLRTNNHFTLKTSPLTRADLDDFVACYKPGERHARMESERFRRFTCDELLARDKASLDIFWLRDDSLEDTDNLPTPSVIAAEIVEDLEAALAEFAELAESLQGAGVDTQADGADGK